MVLIRGDSGPPADPGKLCSLATSENKSVDPLAPFSPGVRRWFESSFEGATDAQAAGWKAVAEMVRVLKRVKRTGGDLRIANPSERVREVLELAGLDSIFEIYPTQVEAVGSF